MADAGFQFATETLPSHIKMIYFVGSLRHMLDLAIATLFDSQRRLVIKKNY
jgi:hypothetical protein